MWPYPAQLNGVPVGSPLALGPGGTYAATIAAPGIDGSYPVRVDYTPTGATTVAATTTQPLTVGALGTTLGPPPSTAAPTGAGGSGSGANNALSIIFGNGGQGGELQASHARVVVGLSTATFWAAWRLSAKVSHSSSVAHYQEAFMGII